MLKNSLIRVLVQMRFAINVRIWLIVNKRMKINVFKFLRAARDVLLFCYTSGYIIKKVNILPSDARKAQANKVVNNAVKK